MSNKYSSLKVLHYKDKLKSLPLSVNSIEAPLHVRLKPTNACNHRCRYCAYLEEDMQLGQNMNIHDSIPHAKMNEIIDDLIDMGVNAVTFSGGGEPLVYPYIVETMHKLADSPIKFALLTNGALLSGEKAEILSQSATWVRISMDGWDDDSYKRYRNAGDGEYTKVMNNIKNFINLEGNCLLGVSLIIDTENCYNIYKTLKKYKEIGVSTVKASACIVGNSGDETNMFHAKTFKKTKEEIQRAIVDLQDDSFEIFDAYHEMNDKFSMDYSWCPYLQIVPVIAADQNVYSCHDKAYNLDSGVIGNIKDQSFKNLWMNGKEKFFKINPSCDCKHHCAVNNHNKLILDYLNVDYYMNT